MAEVLLRGGLVLTEGGMEHTDVLVSGERVEKVGPGLSAPGAEILGCEGAWVGPGLVDLHAHLREPGHEWKEDVGSASEAAAAGGFTAVVAMPNTDPPTDRGHLARFLRERGRQAGLIDVLPAGTITLGGAGKELSHLDELLGAGVTLFTDDGSTVADAGLLRRAMEYLAGSGGVVAQHAEDPGLSGAGHMHEGAVSARLGIEGIPSIAEEVVVARDLALARLTGARYHVQHVSTAGAIDHVRQAKAQGVPVTAEVTPHHLAFSEEAVAGGDPRFKMYPPLRAAADLEALRAGVLDGTIDVVASDHAPHAAHEREVPFEEAPRGVIGLETAAAAVNTYLGLPPEVFFERLSGAPARIAGLEGHGSPPAVGRVANLVVFDPERVWEVRSFRSRSANSPFLGMELRGSVRYTLLRGAVTFREAS